MDFLSARIVSPAVLPFLCFILGTRAQQAFRTEPKNLTVRMGATAVLRCEVLRASGTVQWAKDGFLLGPERSLPGFPRYSMIGNPERGQYHLQIEDAQLEDDTQYECQVTSSESSSGIISRLAWLDVRIPPSKPYFDMDMSTPWEAGKKYTVTCVAPDAKPLAEITLYKDGVELTGAESFSTSGSKDKLLNAHAEVTVTALSSDNGRELACHAMNPTLLKPVETTMAMNVYFEPAELTLSGSLTAIEGQELNLSCYTTSSNPPVDIRWWLGYKELNNTSVAMEEGDNGGMTIMSNMTHRVSREEHGMKLTCEAFNKGTHFSKTQSEELSVYYPPQKVWINAPPEDVPLRSGSTVHMVCFATGGNPKATLAWFKDGTAVTGALQQTSFDMGVARELVVVLTASDNMASYRCDATNKAKKTISAYTKLRVYFTPVSMKIAAQQEVLRQGEALILECQAGSSSPMANISWILGPLRLQGVEEEPRDAEFGGISVHSSLSLNLTSQHHNQKVICQAYSHVLAEGTNTYYKLNVLYPPEFSPDQPTEVQVLEDDMAVIPLLVSANPEEVSCIWLHRREKLVKEEDYRYHWLDDHSLEIRNVSRNDAGGYAVKCENDEGANEISITLDVQYAPSVKAEKEPVFVNLGETADLICVADANPIIAGMFSWKWLGEEEVEMGEETQEDESGLLTIYNVTRAHAGSYECLANNGIEPPASAHIRLVVQFKPELRKGPQWRKVASRGDGTSTAEIVCQAEGVPRVDFSWEKSGVLMDFENPRYEEMIMREGSFHTSTVRVVNVSAVLDYAVFSCTARNSLGEDKLDIQLISTNHPDPPSSFRQVSVGHDSVTLEWIPGFNGGLQQRFRIRYCWDQSVSFLYVDVFPPSETTFTVTGLQPVTTYNFSVNALNAIGESEYADNNAVLTITTKERPDSDEDPSDIDPASQGGSGLPVYLTVVLTAVLGGLLVFNLIGCFFGLRWKKRQGQTAAGSRDSVLDGKKKEDEGSSQSTAGNSNKYESREMINAAAQRTLLVDSGSEADSNVYESYAEECSHYYYPTGVYTPHLSPPPEETRGLDVIRRPVDHLYEDVGMYQDTAAPSRPAPSVVFEHKLSQQRNEWRLPTRPRGAERTRQFMAVHQPQRDSDLPFELRGELV
ncbi:nephrin isoform X3 [Haplochromis burtoni]|uniref:nephrin isoform X3 n=1 Tax=Haplochromis burtoni TaxID=8153 RepID=UPI0006C9AFAE|nr:nephrin isoform X3 [Haplochromis burtoni]